MKALKDPDADGDVDPHLLGELVDVAVHPDADEEDDDEYLVRGEEELVVRVADGGHG